MQRGKALGVMVIPQWKLAPFWSFFVEENGALKSFVKDVKVLPQGNVITQSRDNFGIFSVNSLKFTLIALRIVF